jgi:TPR repeat protein
MPNWIKNNYKHVLLIAGLMILFAWLIDDLSDSYYKVLRWTVFLASVSSFSIQCRKIGGQSIRRYIFCAILFFFSWLSLELARAYFPYGDNLLLIFAWAVNLLIFPALLSSTPHLGLGVWLCIAIIFNPLISFDFDSSWWELMNPFSFSYSLSSISIFETFPYLICFSIAWIGLWFISWYLRQSFHCKKLLVTLTNKRKVENSSHYKNEFKYAQEIFKSSIEDAELGYVKAMFRLAEIYSYPGTFWAMVRGSCDNDQDLTGRLDESIKWLKRAAAEFANVDAKIAKEFFSPAFNCQEIYFDVIEERKKNAENECSIAMFALGTVYEYGYLDTSHLFFSCYPRMCKLTECMKSGDYLSHDRELYWTYWLQPEYLAPNLNEAFKWYKKAAELGHFQSMLRLAAMHTDGEDDLKDLKQARTVIEAQKAKINKAREYYFSSSSQEANNVIPTQSSSNSTPLGESNPEVLSQNFTQYLSPPTKGLLNSSKTNLVSCDGEKAVFQMPEKFKFLKAKLEAKSEEIVEALKVSGSSNLKYITIKLIPTSATTLEAKVVKPEGD